MVLKRVYLDQNQWIALAREASGLSHSPAVADALTLVEEAASSGHEGAETPSDPGSPRRMVSK